MKIKIIDYNSNELIKLMKDQSDNSSDILVDEESIDFETLVKIAKHYHFEITIESTSKTDKMINHMY